MLDQLGTERTTNSAPHNPPADAVDRAKALEAPVPYRPTHVQLQRGRMLRRAELWSRTNIPIARYAALAGKSRQQLYREISARKLLALFNQPRDTHVPAWQLRPAALALTRAVLETATDVDSWTIYWALSAPDDAFDGRAAVATVTPSTVKRVAELVCARLGVYG